MFFTQYIQYHWQADDAANVEEFWTEVFRAYGRARQRILAPANSSNSQWRKAKRMLSRHGWADLSYFRKKQNFLYQGILLAIQQSVHSMRDNEDEQFFNCMWMMESNLRENLTYVAPFPHIALKIFVLLPSPAKAERYLLHSSRKGGVYFLAIHFPTVFPVQGRWPNLSAHASRLLKRFFRHEIVNNVDEIRRVTFASPECISDAEIDQALNCLQLARWNRLNKIYLLLFRQSRDWGDYLNYLREKGAWID